MPLALHTTVTISCAVSEEHSGPTIVHSTGVDAYRIHPEIIHMLQVSCTNEKLCDHEKGVQCTDPPAHILQVFKRAGFSETMSSVAGDRKMWLLTKTSEGDGGDGGDDGGNDGGDDGGDAGGDDAGDDAGGAEE